jgi:hypothetical protein
VRSQNDSLSNSSERVRRSYMAEKGSDDRTERKEGENVVGYRRKSEDIKEKKEKGKGKVKKRNEIEEESDLEDESEEIIDKLGKEMYDICFLFLLFIFREGKYKKKVREKLGKTERRKGKIDAYGKEPGSTERQKKKGCERTRKGEKRF